MIEAREVTVLFKRGLRRKPFRALDGFAIEVSRQDIFALIGPNGAGKSTAMYALLGLIKPDAGIVRLFGQTPKPGSKMFQKIVFIPEEPHYHLYLTVEEALRFYCALYGFPLANRTLNEVLERLGLVEHRKLRLDKCSKGMKQKVGLATCFLTKPEIIFLDEPTRGLDPLVVKEFREMILEMNREGATVLMNSHVLSEVETLCNRVAIMKNGKVILQEDMAALLTKEPERYAVVLDRHDHLPSFVTVVSSEDGKMNGFIPVANAPEFFRFASENKLMIYDCSLKQSSLETAFVHAVEEAK